MATAQLQILAARLHQMRPADRRMKGVERTNDSIDSTLRELGRTFRRIAPAADDRAVALLAAKVRSIDPVATVDEIAYFLEIKAQQAIATRRVTNPVGFLIWSVPQCFGGSMIEDYRDAVREERSRAVARWQQILNDPHADAETIAYARQELDRLEE
jgi:hypothetical protein